MAKGQLKGSTATAGLLLTLKSRFQKNSHRHPSMNWETVENKLLQDKAALSAIEAMESSDGEPDVVSKLGKANEIYFVDCAPESPTGRRSLCYDKEAWMSRKENRPAGNCMDLAVKMGITILSEEQYRVLQTIETVDQKTSSWVLTPSAVRQKGGALFCDYRYGQTFIYHNGASSYYAARGFRGFVLLK